MEHDAPPTASTQRPPWQPALLTPAAPPGPDPVDPSWFIPAEWDRHPLTIYVWGEHRALVNRVVYSMVQSLDAAPLWLEILERGESPDPLRLGWVPQERLFVSERPDDLEPARAVGNLALWSIVRADEPSSLLAHLTDFVRLPPLLQEVLGAVPPGADLRAVAVGNADRVLHLFRDRSDEIRWLLEFLKQSMVCLVIGVTGEPGANRRAFDAEFSVTAPSVAAWENGRLACERSPWGPGLGESQIRLGDIDLLRRLVQPTRSDATGSGSNVEEPASQSTR